MTRLVVQDLHAGYGRQEVLHGITVHVEPGEAVAVLGANGAGKSTLMKAISGSVRPRSGSIEFEGQRLRGGPSGRVRRGVVHVAEGHQVIGTLTVAENLALGAFRDWPFGGAARRKAAEERAYHLFPVLAEKRDQAAGLMSGGQQQMLAIARGLMARPSLLLLDEPSLGLSPILTRELFGIVSAINEEEHTTVVVVEQNAHLALGIAHQAHVLETGRIVLSGTAADIRADEQVAQAYLGYRV